MKQLPGRRHDFIDGDSEQPLFRLAVPCVIGQTARASEHTRSRSKGAIARRIRRTENCHYRDFQSGCQVHRSGIASDEETSAARERD